MQVKPAMDKMEKEMGEMKTFLKTSAEKLSFLERRSDQETGAVTDVFRHLSACELLQHRGGSGRGQGSQVLAPGDKDELH